MTRLREALDDIAGEVSPISPPVELAMRRGRRLRIRRRTQAIAGTAGVMAVAVGAAVGVPSAASHPGGGISPPTSRSTPDVPLYRRVLLEVPYGSTKAFGDPSVVPVATMRLFNQVHCAPTGDPSALNDNWKAAIGYTATEWNAPGRGTVSCDWSGTKYVLGPAVVTSYDITAVSVDLLTNSSQYVVEVKLNSQATSAVTRLTTSQYENYYRTYQQDPSNINDQVLASTAIVVNGDVESAPVTTMPIATGQLEITGPGPAGFTKAEATACAKLLVDAQVAPSR
ncbi:MAG TPA: hypothetical protein VMU95_22680 [Trebonia sp.]|nr:hypothetical protein [Trebonia sp.]